MNMTTCECCGSRGEEPAGVCEECGRVKCELCDMGDDVPCVVCETEGGE